MTDRLPGRIPDPQEPATGALAALLKRARAALLWEALWPPLAAFGSILLLFLSVSWLGLWLVVPPAVRAGGVALFVALGLIALLPLLRLRVPSRAEELARIDRESGAAHRPATALFDDLAISPEDPVTKALWQAHREKIEAQAKRLRAGSPKPHLALRDPRALRFLAILLALVGFVVAGPHRGDRLLSGFDWQNFGFSMVPPRLDAWVAPPAYTGRAPIFLTAQSSADSAVLSDDPVRAVPEGSVLVVRSTNGEAEISAADGLKLLPVEPPKKGDKPAAVAQPKEVAQPAASDAVNENRFTLAGEGTVRVELGGQDRSWRFRTIPDAPPKIAFDAPPGTTEKGALTLRYNAEDDYGITQAQAIIVPQTSMLTGGPTSHPLYGAPDVHLPVPGGRGGHAVANAALADHPWAGAKVRITLRVRDEAGHEGRSETVDAVMPERSFTQPLARALVEQRRNLALDANSRDRVEEALNALSLFPEVFNMEAGVYLGLRAAYTRLDTARSDDDLRSTCDLLWEMALQLEDGDLSRTEADLKSAIKALQDALQRGASDEEIAKLMDQLKSALAQHLQELAKRAQEGRGEQAMSPDTKMITPQDLAGMLKRMEDLARGGNRQAAQDLLSQLDNLMQNLRPGGGQGANPAEQALDELGNIIRDQSRLRDRTFRQDGQQQNGQQGQGQGERQEGRGDQQGQRSGQHPGQRGGQQQGGRGENGRGLSQEQGRLRERLDSLMQQMDGLGLEGDPAFGDAGKAMGDAQGQLGKGETGQALENQAQALEALRRGARSMAERMAEQAGPGGGGGGVRGNRLSGEDTDPLGRPSRARRFDPGTSVRVPGEIAAERARKILEELRRRVSDPTRSQEEIDYLERLLREN